MASTVRVVLMTFYETDMYSQAAASAGPERVIGKRHLNAVVRDIVDRLCAVEQGFRLEGDRASGDSSDPSDEPA